MPTLKTHYDLFGDGEFVYVYIYKNACTTFKRLIIANIPRTPENASASNVELMKVRLVSLEKAQEAKHRLFVIRNPVERVVSGFLNQIVENPELHYPEMFDVIEKTIEKPIAEVTFRDFVIKYLAASNLKNINSHFHPVTTTLAPLKYDSVIEMKDLYESSKSLFGLEIANKYFKQRINSSTNNKTLPADNYYDMSIGDLHSKYLANGLHPSKKDMLDKEILQCIQSIFSSDIQLFNDFKEKKNLSNKYISFDNKSKILT